MKQTQTNEPTDPMKVIFNYNNVFFSFFYDDNSLCVHRSREFAMNYVYSGEMILDNGGEPIHVGKGECVFIPRDHHITMRKQSCNGERYCGIFLSFLPMLLCLPGRGYLFFEKLYFGLVTISVAALVPPYFDPEVKPQDDFMQLKLQEGLLALLHIDRRFAPTLFDFNEPWKIDIMEFMNQNYMYEFTLEDLAHYTGRSLATFKRDFKKLSDLTPEKWLIRKRLEVAYALMKEGGKKIVDVYAEVGFKNPSHFSTAFKRQYGIPPTAVSA